MNKDAGFKRALFKAMLWSTAALFAGLIALIVAVVELLAPAKGEWPYALRIGGVRAGITLPVSVPAVIRTATHPRVGPWLHGLKLQSAYGPLELGWRESTQSLHVLCAPCSVHRPELSRVPLRFEAVELSVQQQSATSLHGAVFAGEVLATWQGELSSTALNIQMQLPETPLAALFALAGDAVPEARRAKISGSASAVAHLRLPAGQWSFVPTLHSFGVSGLGTEALLTAKPDARCKGASAKSRRSNVWLERAVIAAEDQKFYQHPGYDLEEMLAALASNQSARGIERGASTITQQLAKLIFTGDERTHARKLAELLYAVEMEQTLGKARILQWYIALAPWGHGVCGTQAAMHYLGKSAGQLTAVEAAWLAGMLRNPAVAAAKLQVHGEIDVQRTLHVIESLRPVAREKRKAFAQELNEWRPPVMVSASLQ
jgi:hypothetical protein